MSRSDNMFDVIIIGAGLSGLVAASMLRERGCNACVVEARDRSGGRIWSVPLGPRQALDLGAQWICDRQIHITKLVQQLGLRVHATWQHGQKLHHDGSMIRRVNAHYTPLSWLQKIDALRIQWTMSRALKRNAPGSNDVLDHVTASEFLKASSWSKTTSDYLANMITADMCIDIGEISVPELLNQVRSMGGMSAVGEAEQYIISGGASQITDYLAEGLEDRLFLGRQVTEVNQRSSRIEVETTSGTFIGRHVIFAIPPQCLSRVAFSPPLPSERTRQWKSFRRGKVIKTSAVFNEPFWRASGLSGTMEHCDPMFPLIVDSSESVGGRGILTALSTAHAATLLEKLPKSERELHYRSMLESLLGPVVPPFEMVNSTDWSSEEFSLGGYASRRAPGAWTGVPELFSNIGNIHFAGTETADEWRSYMEGAITSGQRAAREIANALS